MLSAHLYQPTELELNAFSLVGVKIWNGIPQILKERLKKAFKRSLKEMLLDILETEVSYIDVDIYDHRENEKVILLSFIFILFYF